MKKELNEIISQEQGLILRLLDKAGWNYKKIGKEYMGACPVCNNGHNTPNTVFNLDTNSFKCFACQSSGGLKDLSNHLQIDFKEFLKEEGIISEEKNNGKKDKQYQGFEKVKNANKSYTTKEINLEKISSLVIEQDVKEYLKSRFINPDRVANYIRSLKPIQDKSFKYLEDYYKEGYKLLIPSFDLNGNLKAVKIRNIKGKEPKVKNLSGFKQYPLGIDEIFYTDEEGNIQKHDIAVILEGEIDYLTAKSLFYDHKADLFIAIPSVNYKFQKEEKEALPEKIFILLDNDQAGKQASEQLARDLKKAGKQVYIASYPEGIKDFNELVEKLGEEKAKEEFSEIIYKALLNPFTLTKTLKDTGINLLKRLEERIKKAEAEGKDKPEPIVLKTGLEFLDNLLDGGLRRGLYAIAGQPAIGKTSFTLALSKHLAEAGHKVLFFSLEMTDEDLLIQLLSWITGIHKRKILDEEISKIELNELQEALEHYIFRNIFIDIESKTIDDIENKVIDTLNDVGDKRLIVFIDYLQQIRPSKELLRSDYRLQMKDIAYKLKEIANKYELPVFVISSTQREGYNAKPDGKKKTEPNYIAMFKESGDIEYSLYAGYFLDYPREDLPPDYIKANYELPIKVVKVKSRFGHTKDENHNQIFKVSVLNFKNGRLEDIKDLKNKDNENRIVEEFDEYDLLY